MQNGGEDSKPPVFYSAFIIHHSAFPTIRPCPSCPCSTPPPTPTLGTTSPPPAGTSGGTSTPRNSRPTGHPAACRSWPPFSRGSSSTPNTCVVTTATSAGRPAG